MSRPQNGEEPEVYTITKDLPTGQTISWEDFCDKFGLVDSEDSDGHKAFLLKRSQLKTRANLSAQSRKDSWRLITTRGVGVTRREGTAMVNEITKEVLTRVGHAIEAAKQEMGRLKLLTDTPDANRQMIEIVLSTVITQIDIQKNMIGVLPVEEVKESLKEKFLKKS